MKKIILSVIVIATMCGLLNAVPFQTLGMLRTPDAYVLPHTAAEIMVGGYYRDVAKPVDYDGFTPFVMLGVGILDRVELGLLVGDKIEDEPLVYFLNVKAKILQETSLLPQLSVGIDNILSPIGETSVEDLNPGDDFYNHPDNAGYEIYSPYVVASKQAVILGMPWMLNLGAGAHRFTGQASRSRVLNGFFASAEMSPVQNLTLQGEFDGQDVNAGIKYSYRNWGVKVGAQALEDLTKDNGYEDNLRLAFGLSYLFDKYAEAKRRPDIRTYAKDEHLEESYVVDLGTGSVEKSSPTDKAIVDKQIVPTPQDTRPGETVTTPTGTLETPGYAEGDAISSQAQLSPEIRDLLEELRILRTEREKAQKSLDDLRAWIEQLKQEKK